MQLSINWIKKFLSENVNLSPKELSDIITLKTAEVEGYEDQAAGLAFVVLGQILEIKDHPNADSLKICITDIGDKKVQIICGGSNVAEDMLVACALPGSKVKWHGEGDLVEIEATTIRGEDSYGMIAASSEIGLGEAKGKEIMDLNYLKSQDIQPGDLISEALNLKDIIFEIDNKSITNRPDLWGHLGFARELAAITQCDFIPPTPQVSIPSSGEEIQITVENKDILQRWNSCLVKNIKITPSPNWIQTQLKNAGVNPVNNIVDITNYVMLELGLPMHAYDYDKIGTNKLSIRYAKDSETLETIDHKTRKLTKLDPILAGKEPLIVLGIMGGANSEITDKTTSILLEAANWDPIIIRKASERHALRTDASARYEKSLDSELCPLAIKRALELILEICPEATIAGPITDLYPKKLNQLTIELNTKKVRSYLGTDLANSEIKIVLENLDFKVSNANTDLFQVVIPSHRATKDVELQEDLIEEVVRMYGYDKIPAELPTLEIKMPIQNLARERKHQASQILSSLGIDEVINYSFYSQKNFEDCFFDEKDHLKLKNYLSEEQSHMRVSLLPNILKNIHLNLKNFDSVAIYEFGRVYPEIGEYFPAEEEKLAIAVTGPNSTLRLKGILEEFFAQFSHQKLTIQRHPNPSKQAHPNKAGMIFDPNKPADQLAEFYAVHPLILENFDIQEEVSFAELNFGRLEHLKDHAHLYQKITKFPSLSFDLSVVVDKHTENQTILKTLQDLSELIVNINLFDLYEGDKLPENKKAMGYKITLQHPERTLKENEMNKVQQDCIAKLKEIGGEVRGA